MTTDFEDRIRDVSDWMIESALTAVDYSEIFDGFCARLRDAGVPVCRINISMRTLHPMAEAISLVWVDGQDVDIRFHPHGVTDSEVWRLSPLKVMLDRQDSEIRYTGDALVEAAEQLPLLKDLLAEGVTDYQAFAVTFSDENAPFENRDGLLASFASEKPGGFTAEHIDAIRKLMPRFGLVAKLANRERLFTNILDAYLGPDAGRHVRNGQIALGSGQLIDTVIWFSDLRESTPLAEELGPQEFLALLNDYFNALAGAVLEHEGQVLRFIGDAALAIFPIGENGFLPAEARARAERAARSAIDRAAGINATREADGKKPFGFGIGLHVGRIMYGNIGVPERVEFSVVGAAANEAARIEGLCKGLDETVLASQQFVASSPSTWRDLGQHAIRGSQDRRQIYGLMTQPDESEA